ncbi:MAG: hypothetical protein ABIT05_10185 [Chitinophagaceae bacterium]
MKKLLFLLATGLTLVTFSCKKEATQPNPGADNGMTTGGGGTTTKTTAYIWKINSFVVSGNDMTAQFANYQFDIRAAQLLVEDGVIVAVAGSTTYYGKWHRVSFNEVIINFPDAPLSPLNDDWIITNNLEHDIAMQTSSKTLSFHNDGQTWSTGK